MANHAATQNPTTANMEMEASNSAQAFIRENMLAIRKTRGYWRYSLVIASSCSRWGLMEDEVSPSRLLSTPQ